MFSNVERSVLATVLLAATFGSNWGFHLPVQDTPEVAAAKAEHFAAVAAAKHGKHYIPKPQYHHYAPHHDYEESPKKWTGPIALPPGYDKHGAPLPVLDLPEVAAEKAKHYHLYSHGAHAGAALAHQYASTYSAPEWNHQPHHHDNHHYQSHAPSWQSHGAPLPVVDLPAVSAEREKHLHLYSYGPYAGAVAAAH